MSYDYEVSMDSFYEDQRKRALKIAAYYISKGMSRNGAIEKAKNYLKEQEEIPNNNDGRLDALAKKYGVPLDPDSYLNTQQVQAIAEDIDDMADYP